MPARSNKRAPFQDQLLELIATKADTIGKGMAQRLGPAPQHGKLSEREIAFLWNHEVPGIDEQALLDQGLTAEEIARVRWPHRERLYKSMGGPSWEGQVKAAQRLRRLAARFPKEPLAREEPQPLAAGMAEQRQAVETGPPTSEPPADEMTETEGY